LYEHIKEIKKLS